VEMAGGGGRGRTVVRERTTGGRWRRRGSAGT
jgi:hypothetical protein